MAARAMRQEGVSAITGGCVRHMKICRKIDLLAGICALGMAVFFLPGFVFGGEGNTAAQEGGESVRPARFAGTFYSGQKQQLRKNIAKLVEDVPETEVEGKICGAVAPHAGYRYSGSVAAYTHKMLAQAEFDTVIIIGHDTFRNVAALISPHDYFETPLGRVSVDTNMAQRLVNAHEDIVINAAVHIKEHTIEVQLPFFQALKKDFKIVPVLFGTPSKENIKTLSNAIIEVTGKSGTLVLASTDLSHYPSYETASVVDKSTIEVMRLYDIDKLLLHLRKRERKGYPGLKTAMCARGGVCTAMLVARKKGADTVQFLHYANSGDSPGGGKKSVVGYCSVLFTKTNDD